MTNSNPRVLVTELEYRKAERSFVSASGLECVRAPEAEAALAAAIRDAFASIHDFQGVVPGKISFCADPTPQCRDGNRTPILVEYTKGGKDYEMKQLATVTFDPDFGLKK